MKTTSEFAGRLAGLRHEEGVLQKELAVYLNVSVGTISNYEKGVHQPNLDILCGLADYYKVSTDYLLGRDGNLLYGIYLGQNGEEVIRRLRKIFLDIIKVTPGNLSVVELFLEYLRTHEVIINDIKNRF